MAKTKMNSREKVAFQLGILTEKCKRMAQIQDARSFERLEPPLDTQSDIMILEVAGVFDEIKRLDKTTYLNLICSENFGPVFRVVAEARPAAAVAVAGGE